MKKMDMPFSKKNVVYARMEAYIFSAVLILLTWLGKDVSPISVLLTLAWGGYKLLQASYMKMAEREHLEEIRTGRLHKDLDTSDIDDDIEELESDILNHDLMEDL